MLARFSVLKKAPASLFFLSALMKSLGSFAVLGGAVGSVPSTVSLRLFYLLEAGCPIDPPT